LSQTERVNDAPIFALRAKNIGETSETVTATPATKGSKLAKVVGKGKEVMGQGMSTAYLFRTPQGGDGDGRWRVSRHTFHGPSSAAAIESALPSVLPTDPGVNFLVRGQSMGKWGESKITAVDRSTIAPPVLIVKGDNSIAAKVEAKVMTALGEGRDENVTEGLFWGTYILQEGRQVNGYPLYASDSGMLNAYLYRSADGGQGDGRWRLTRTETDIAKDE
jgi:hypothetical protein